MCEKETKKKKKKKKYKKIIYKNWFIWKSKNSSIHVKMLVIS